SCATAITRRGTRLGCSSQLLPGSPLPEPARRYSREERSFQSNSHPAWAQLIPAFTAFFWHRLPIECFARIPKNPSLSFQFCLANLTALSAMSGPMHEAGVTVRYLGLHRLGGTNMSMHESPAAWFGNLAGE